MNSDQDRLPVWPSRTLLTRAEFGSFVFAPYVIAVVWQYFCALHYKPLAWALTLIVAAVVWTSYLTLAENHLSRAPWTFWLLVASPLLFFYLLLEIVQFVP